MSFLKKKKREKGKNRISTSNHDFMDIIALDEAKTVRCHGNPPKIAQITGGVLRHDFEHLKPSLLRSLDLIVAKLEQFRQSR